MITECPHCKNRFLVMENLFRSSDGNARCGACMQTFKVFDHLKDYGASAGGLLVNPELARKRLDEKQSARNTGSSTIAQREREDGRVEPVLLGTEFATDGPRFTAQLEPDPIDMRSREASLGERIATWLPTVLGAFLALTLGWLIYLQWFEVAAEDLPDNAFMQGAHRYACAVLRCAASDSNKNIVSRQLVVYSHPEQADALMVETVIVNLGQRPRPFPQLKLEFHDLQGKIVASRVFKPADYLAGELAGKRALEPQTPVQLELQIVDPGAHAVNYALEILPGR